MKRTIAVGFIAVALAVGSLSAASASDDDVRRSGPCSDSSNWKLKLSPENGRIEVEFEVDQNRNGQDWHVVMKRDGNVFFRGTRTTKGPSGSFEARDVIGNSAGPDRITARAHDPRTDEVCRGSATF